jgi:predicted metal-dependent hydrolase
MSTESSRIRVGGIDVLIVRKDIRNLHLGVYPPDGRVRVATPLRLGDEAVRLAVISKLSWIRTQRARFGEQPRQSRREMAEGESHFYFGRRYRLRVVPDAGRVSIRIAASGMLELHAPGAISRERLLELLNRWYRSELRKRALPLIAMWEERLEVRLSFVGVKAMKTKWASCNPDSGRIWLNLELAKKAFECLEYIVVHELIHLIERRHGDQFVALMDRHLPNWRHLRKLLNAAPLGHANWSY